MKNALLILVSVALLGYAAWHYLAPAPKPPPPVARPQAQRTLVVKPATAARARPTAAKRPSPQQAAATPTPAHSIFSREQRLAPEGTYFLLQRVSLKIDSGVVGFAPGTKVILVENNQPMSTVTDGTYQFQVPPTLLTNDLDLAESAAKSDWAAQAQIAESIGEAVREHQQQELDEIAAHEQEKAQRKTGKKPPLLRRSPTPAPARPR